MKLAIRLAAVMAIALVAAPTAGAAKPRAKVMTLTGQVMAAPYADGRKVVVPVLVDRLSLRRAKLRAPVGVLLLKKARSVKVRGQRARVAPALLRAGDRLRARVKVTRVVRKASYWRTPARSFKLTKRSPTFSPAELQALLGAFGKDITRLDATLIALAKYVQAGFQKQAAQLGSLATALQALEKRVKALEAGLPALESRLQAQLDALAQQFSSLGAQLTTLQAQLTALDGDVKGLEADMAAMEGQMAQLSADVTALQTSVAALCGDPLVTVC